MEKIEKSRQPAPPAKETIFVSKNTDPYIFICIILLCLIGIVMVLSSSYYTAYSRIGNMYHFFRSQTQAVLLGFGVMLIASQVDYRILKWPSYLGYVAANGFLAWLIKYGEEINGAKRWFRWGPISFQPSEFAKAMVILTLAFYIFGDKDRANSLKGLGKCLIIIGIPCVLVKLGNNMSTAIIIAAIGFGMLFIASSYTKLLITTAIAGASALVTYLFLGGGFRSGRMAAWLDPWSVYSGKGFQVIQSLYAVASGGFFGLGLGQSRQKLRFMPEPQNDLIFAVICEELGFFGAFIVLLLFAVLLWRGIKVALSATDLLGTYIAAGIVTLIGVQVIINVGVVTNTIPNTGIPLPFISYGGTSLIANLISIGLVLSVRCRYKIINF